MTEIDADADLPLRVSTLELFFDLVFVFAITQLTGVLGWVPPCAGDPGGSSHRGNTVKP